MDEGAGWWYWALNTNGAFSVASLRHAYDDKGLRRYGPYTRWNKAIPTKVRILGWRIALNRLPTKDNLLKIGVTMSNDSCPLCQGCPESKEHIFKECCKVQEVRRLLNGWWKIFPGTRIGGQDGLVGSEERNTGMKKTEIAKEVVRDAFAWIVWKKRNDIVFKNASFIPSLIANDIQAIAFFWFHNRVYCSSSVS